MYDWLSKSVTLNDLERRMAVILRQHIEGVRL